MARKLGLLAICTLAAAYFTACCDFPIDPYPPGDPADTLGTGWPDNGGTGGDTVIIDYPDDGHGNGHGHGHGHGGPGHGGGNGHGHGHGGHGNGGGDTLVIDP